MHKIDQILHKSELKWKQMYENADKSVSIVFCEMNDDGHLHKTFSNPMTLEKANKHFEMCLETNNYTKQLP